MVSHASSLSEVNPEDNTHGSAPMSVADEGQVCAIKPQLGQTKWTEERGERVGQCVKLCCMYFCLSYA